MRNVNVLLVSVPLFKVQKVKISGVVQFLEVLIFAEVLQLTFVSQKISVKRGVRAKNVLLLKDGNVLRRVGAFVREVHPVLEVMSLGC